MFLGAVNFPSSGVVVYPLAIGGVAIIASVIGTFFARVGRTGSIINALYKAVLVATVLSAVGVIPLPMAFDSDRFSFGALSGCAPRGLAVHFLTVCITES